MTVKASSNFLKPILVLKVIPGRKIEQYEFPTFPTQISHKCQNNMWMDEDIIGEWIEEVLKPYVANVPGDIVPMLVLDTDRCHVMTLVVQKIQDLGVGVEHSPDGCTCLCQPVDKGVNNPLKKLNSKTLGKVDDL